MPTYEYKCDECGIVFDRFQHFSEEPLRICPECSGPIHRVIQPVGIVFKGKGFYVTDNKANSATVAPKSESNDSSSSGEDRSSASEDKSSASEAKSAPSSSESGTEKKEKQTS